jgi:hypothetical protein
MVPIQVTNTSQSEGGISVQRVDANGAVQLDANGMELLSLSLDLPMPADASATSDGAIVVYSEGGFGNEHISAMRLGAVGFTVWSPFSTVLCSANSNKDDASCGAYINGQVVVVWDDDRSGNGVFAQNIFGYGTIGTPTAVEEITGTTDVRLQMNPSGQATLVFGPRSSRMCMITLLDMRGRTVLAERTDLGEGARVALPTLGLAPGLYAIRVDNPTGFRTLHWVKE